MEHKYQSYKGRAIDFSKPVAIYRNLHNKMYSVKQGGLVVAHLDSFTMKRVSFVVREGGRRKVIATRQKAIHAFICGQLLNVNKAEGYDDQLRISYNPYKSASFFYVCNEKPVALLDKHNALHGNEFGLFPL